MKIKTRLILNFSYIVAFILILFSVGIYLFYMNYRQNDFMLRLRNKAISTVNMLENVPEIDSSMLKLMDRNTVNNLFDTHVIIRNEKNQIVYNNKDSILTNNSNQFLNNVRKNKTITFKTGDRVTVGILYTCKNNDYIVIISAIDIFGKKELANLRNILIICIVISIGISILGGILNARQSLSPILKVINQVDKIKATTLYNRVKVENNEDEIGILANTFNKMLNRIESAFEFERNFISNASHEMRTPLTSITGQIEVALINKRTVEEYEATLNSLLVDIKELNALSNGFLELAQAEIDNMSSNSPDIRIDELLYEVRESLVKQRPIYQMSIEFINLPKDENQLIIKGNPILIKILFTNLIDNACKFSYDTKVKIVLDFNEYGIIIKFIDQGVGIKQDELDAVFESFYRSKNSNNAEGHGLGLSIVKKIIKVHNGSVKINSELNIGTTITVILPHNHLTTYNFQNYSL